MIPRSHPRYRSLLERELIVRAYKRGLLAIQGLIAHGRGEAFDYLLGERTHGFARAAERAAVAQLLLAKRAVISVNGNAAALAAKELAELARLVGAKLEVNIFYYSRARVLAIARELRKYSSDVLYKHDARLPGLDSARARVCSEGIASADVVLVAIEDGDRTRALRKAGKKVIAIELNPLSRTARDANITIVDNITRALPYMCELAIKMRSRNPRELKRAIKNFKNSACLKQARSYLLRRAAHARASGGA